MCHAGDRARYWGRSSGRPRFRPRSFARATCGFGSERAASVGPTCTSATGSCPSPSDPVLTRAAVSASPGWDGLRRCRYCRAGRAAAHVVAQVAIPEGRRVLAFTRQGEDEAQSLARTLGIEWAGAVGERPRNSTPRSSSHPLGSSFPRRWRLRKGGTVACAGIHMSIDSGVCLRAALGRARRSVGRKPDREDGRELFQAIRVQSVKTAVEVFPLLAAEDALDRLCRGAVRRAAVLSVAGQPPATM
jgi:hypothetical protein